MIIMIKQMKVFNFLNDKSDFIDAYLYSVYFSQWIFENHRKMKDHEWLDDYMI